MQNNVLIKKTFIALVIIFILLVFQSLALAENAPKKTPSSNEQTTEKKLVKEYDDPALSLAKEEGAVSKIASLIWNIVKYIFVLLLALGLAYFGVHTVTKLMVMRGLSPQGSAGAIKMLDTIYLAQNKALHLVEIGDEILLVSSSQNNINLIKEIKHHEQLDEILEQKRERAQNIQQPFSNVLDNITQRARQSLSGRRRSNMQSSIQSTIKSLKGNLSTLKSRNSGKTKNPDKF